MKIKGYFRKGTIVLLVIGPNVHDIKHNSYNAYSPIFGYVNISKTDLKEFVRISKAHFLGASNGHYIPSVLLNAEIVKP